MMVGTMVPTYLDFCRLCHLADMPKCHAPSRYSVEAYTFAVGRLNLVDTHRDSIQIATIPGFEVDLNQVRGK